MPGSDWYDECAAMDYPFDDAASLVDDIGAEATIGVVDCRLSFPESIGKTAFVSAYASTPNLVTVVLSLSSHFVRPSRLNPQVGSPVVAAAAMISLLKSNVQLFSPVKLESRAAGVEGWIVFGPEIETIYSGRFSSQVQSGLLLRCARSYQRSSGIDWIGSAYNQYVLRNGVGPGTFEPLAASKKQFGGVVKLRTAGDVKITYGLQSGPYVAGLENFDIPDPADALVVPTITFSLGNTANRNVAQLYSGPCNSRPENRNCVVPAVETLNKVQPDCNHNINLYFEGIDAAAIDGGMELFYDATLADVCGPVNADLPDSSGQLPMLAVDLCGEESGVSTVEPLSMMTFSMPAPMMAMRSAPRPAVADLPYEAALHDGLPLDWRVVSGSFDRDYDRTPVLLSIDAAARCVAVREFDSMPNQFEVSARIRLVPRPSRNAGLVLFERTIGGRSRYLIALLDKDTDSLQLAVFNGTIMVEPHARVDTAAPTADWITLRAQCQLEGDRYATISVQAAVSTALGDDSPFAVLPPTRVPLLLKEPWSFGIAALRAISEFESFKVTEIVT